MRFTFAVIALISAIASVSASTFYARQSLPSCAVPCIENANYGSCDHQDNVCLCNDPTFVSSTTTCIESACDASDLANAEQYSQAICRSVGVTLTSTPSATPTGSSTGSATSSSSTSSASAAAQTGAALSTGVNTLAGVAALGVGIFALAL